MPNHKVEQVFVTRDFIVITGYKLPASVTDSPPLQQTCFLAVFSSKPNRSSVHFYELFPNDTQLQLSSMDDNYQLN